MTVRYELFREIHQSLVSQDDWPNIFVPGRCALGTSFGINNVISNIHYFCSLIGNGIGRALAISLAKMGSTLILWDINKEGNEETAAEIKKFGGRATTYTIDLSKRDQIYATAEQVSMTEPLRLLLLCGWLKSLFKCSIVDGVLKPQTSTRH